MPRLWSQTIESHRNEVREAIVNSTAALASSSGPFTVTMSEIAETVGISRATLYKYFSGVEEILDFWHERQIDEHLKQMSAEAVNDRLPLDRLTTILTRYARVQRRRSKHAAGDHGIELTSFLHRPGGVAHAAAQRLHELVQNVIAEAQASGQIRTDIVPAELAHICLHALDAAAHLQSDAAVDRLVRLILAILENQYVSS